MKRKEIEIVFDKKGPLIVLKSDLEIKLDNVEELNRDINFWRGLIYGMLISSFVFIIILFLLVRFI